MGEMKFHLALDSPEMRRVYDLAAETQVPVMMHIQNFPHFPGELPYNTGYDRFDKILSAYPKQSSWGTETFSGHTLARMFRLTADTPQDPLSRADLRTGGYPTIPICTRISPPTLATTRSRAIPTFRAISSLAIKIN